MKKAQLKEIEEYIESFYSYIDDYRRNLNKQGIWLFLATLGLISIKPPLLQLIATCIAFLIFTSKLFSEWKEEGAHITFKEAERLVIEKIHSLDNLYERERIHRIFMLKKKRKLNLSTTITSTCIYIVTFLFFIFCSFKLLIW